MIHHTCIFALLFIILAVNHVTYGEEMSDEINEDCSSPSCNDLEKARRCGNYEWCKQQAIACGARQFLVQGSKDLWKNVLAELDGYCYNSYEPFKKLYGSPDLVDINLQVSPGREPFTLSFDFKGDTGSATSKHGISVKLNNEVVYDNFNVVYGPSATRI